MKYSLLVACLALTSCASLQQAPLIYSSKSTVGLDLSSSTTESPGASISVGVKLVDAAYVPVAVSKRIGAKDDSDTNKEIHRIEAIFGEGITQGSLESLTEENKRKIINYLNAKLTEEALDAQISELNKKKDSLISEKVGFDRRIEEINLEVTTISPGDIDKSPLIADLKTQIKSSENEIKNTEQQIAALKPKYDAAVKNSLDLFEAASKAASFLRTDKRDAMSVYGRFGSRSTAEVSATKAGLAAGKIFSTGVASQNLTEAARYEAMYDGVAKCLESVLEIYKAATDPKDRKEIADMVCICDPVYLKQLESSERK